MFLLCIREMLGLEIEMDVVGEAEPADQHCSLTLSSIDGAGGFNKDRNCLILVL